MSLSQNTLGQLKDLVELKDQLEDIQKRVEDEIQAGLPPVRIKQALVSFICWGYVVETFYKWNTLVMPGLNSPLLYLSGRQSAGFAVPEGVSGWVRCCKAALFSINGCCHRNMYGNVCGTELCCSQHWKHNQRLHTQPERKQQIDCIKARRQESMVQLHTGTLKSDVFHFYFPLLHWKSSGGETCKHRSCPSFHCMNLHSATSKPLQLL